jgi:hypothetical protein
VKAPVSRTGEDAMKAAFTLLLATCLTTSANAATVVSVGYGNTICVSEGSRRITFCLVCTGDIPWGARSTAILKQLTPVGSEVTLRVQTKERY